ncbi:hypothetical protein [Natrialba sp. INN-245]|uniref:hypothetical protein n=1 Tax=Natrialba sp. INN-245 TaxID=2690967 RepID=UPI001312CB18|nr:hypothetical protein [Natrialba sp. INN-245]MWV39429.1 hypothetical protein [Natrialba sp. INN-245]
MAPESALVADAVAAVAGGVTAGVVGAAAVTGFVRTEPDLPGVGDPATVRGQYARYLSVLFLVVLLLVAALESATRAGTLAIGAVVGGDRCRTLGARGRRVRSAERPHPRG